MNTEEEMTIQGFKGFDKDFKCQGFQFEVGKTHEHEGPIQLCPTKEQAAKGLGGFHFCEDPFDVWKYYPVLDENAGSNRFALVEAEDVSKDRDGDSKRVANKLTIKLELSLKALVEAGVKFFFEKTDFVKEIGRAKECSGNAAQLAASGNAAKLAASGNAAKLAASGYAAKLAASGNAAKLAASGDAAQLAASGYAAKLAASGDDAQLAASGYAAKLAASGYAAKLAASGDDAQLAASGYAAKLAASGNAAKLAASGNAAKLAASGDAAQLAASGDDAQLAASGDDAQLAASGNAAKLAASGNAAKLENSGARGICAGVGIHNMARGKIGCWLVLAEYENTAAGWCVVGVTAGRVDGKKIKADIFYKLEGGKFVVARD